MKMNRVSLLLVAAVCAFSGCTSAKKGSSKQGGSSSAQRTSTDTRDIPYEEVYNDYEEHYRKTIKKSESEDDFYDFRTLKGDDLMDEMHTYFIREHKTYIKYENIRFYENTATDLDPTTGKKELFYTGKQVEAADNNYDREHVWACNCSNGLWKRSQAGGAIATEHDISIESGTYSYWGAGSDLFHLRPATGSVNSNRSDASFYDYPDSELSSLRRLSDGGPYYAYVDEKATKVEVADEFKGDVARILMYIYVHYSSGKENVYYSSEHTPVYSLEEAISETGHSPYVCGSLNLTNIMAYDNDKDCFETIVRWNQIDPPSAVEVNRNNYVETVQGNRNPFIDYPQLVRNMLFD